jgi:hypothetical protein
VARINRPRDYRALCTYPPPAVWCVPEEAQAISDERRVVVASPVAGIISRRQIADPFYSQTTDRSPTVTGMLLVRTGYQYQ